VRVLRIPHRLGCEAVALVMHLKRMGKSVETAIITMMREGFDVQSIKKPPLQNLVVTVFLPRTDM
jgi:hypothetical protein